MVHKKQRSLSDGQYSLRGLGIMRTYRFCTYYRNRFSNASYYFANGVHS